METVAQRLIRLNPSPSPNKTVEKAKPDVENLANLKRKPFKKEFEDDVSSNKIQKLGNFEMGGKKANGKPRLSMGGSPIKGPKQFNKSQTKQQKGVGRAPPMIGKFPETKGKDGAASDAKPDWAAMKQESKTKRLERKKKKCTESVFELSCAAKKIWEDLRKEKGDHTKTTEALYDILKTNLEKVIFAHDMSRTVQWLLHLGSLEMRTEIIKELTPSVKKMIVSKYASKCVKKMLKYGNKESGEAVVETFMGSAVKLSCSTISAPIVEFGYANAATPKQKNRLKQEFYSDLFKLSKDDSIKSLSDIFTQMPQLKNAHLSCTKRNLKRMIEKKTYQTSLFYAVLNDFLKNCTKPDMAELLGDVREHLTDFPDSEDAADVGMQCIIQSSNKEKKAIMKNLKGHIVNMSKAKFNHRIIIALIDSIDDTVVFGKILLSEVIANVKDLSSDPYGRRVVAYLIGHRDANFFSGKQEYFERLDELLKETTSKKPTELRQKDICAVVATPFLDAVAEDVPHWFSETRIAMVSLTIFTHGSGESLEKAYTKLAEHLCSQPAKIKHEKVMMTLVEHPGINWVLKKLLKHSHDGIRLFSSILAKTIDETTIAEWLTTNKGAFFIVNLLETEDEETTKEITNKLKPFSQTLKEKDLQGTKLILKKLNI